MFVSKCAFYHVVIADAGRASDLAYSLEMQDTDNSASKGLAMNPMMLSVWQGMGNGLRLPVILLAILNAPGRVWYPFSMMYVSPVPPFSMGEDVRVSAIARRGISQKSGWPVRKSFIPHPY